ncbi:MAG: T9SS C-terminal target domain-containing protein, partial [Planctomycetaceae bacterium]
IEWNISIYDCDWNWPIVAKFAANRAWWQSPWGNAAHYNEVRVHAKPSVTVSSGPVPTIAPDLEIRELSFATPNMDGRLTEPLWNNPLVYKFNIKYGDTALRATYPATGPYRSGQFQPTLPTGLASVLNPGDATVRIFFQGDFLYFGFDVRDNVVQYHANFDRWDGFIVTLTNYTEKGPDQNLATERLTFQVAQNGTATPQDDLAHLVAVDSARVVLALKPGTIVDTVGTSADQGYTAEMRVNLRALGYPVGLGDGRLFLGVNLLDGDSYTPPSLSYGTRTWWFREYEGECCPGVAYLRQDVASGVEPTLPGPREGYRLLGSFPNPARSQRIQFSLAERSLVGFEVFDVAGRLIERRNPDLQNAGTGEVSFNGRDRGHGVYFYRVTILDPESGARRAVLQGRMLMLQ